VHVISKFEIKRLFGHNDVSIDISENNLVLVGPNGIGKSTIANVFYFFVSRQWSRLLEYEFSEISISVGDALITARKDDIIRLSEFNRVYRQFAESSRTRHIFDKLANKGLTERFFSDRKLTQKERQQFSVLLELPEDEIIFTQKQFLRRFLSSENDLFSVPSIQLENSISNAISSRILYLPTYRRIEKELKEVIPDFEERYRAHIRSDEPFRFGRSAGHFVELVSFGMEDIKARIKEKSQELRDYSLSQHNNLSAAYLRDVIHERGDEYNTDEINALDDDKISENLNRVGEYQLSDNDKKLLRSKIKSLQGRSKSDVSHHDRFMAHYFSRLMEINVDITKRELGIKTFVDVCNNYLRPQKKMVYNEMDLNIIIIDQSNAVLDLNVLSSGEKQVIAIFARLYLDSAEDQIVIIDEPELSLSVPWQKRFLTDIADSGKCGFLLAVTHSPFIYDNRLRPHSVDLRRRIKRAR
jgi:predicted ATPase